MWFPRDKEFLKSKGSPSSEKNGKQRNGINVLQCHDEGVQATMEEWKGHQNQLLWMCSQRRHPDYHLIQVA